MYILVLLQSNKDCLTFTTTYIYDVKEPTDLVQARITISFYAGFNYLLMNVPDKHIYFLDSN